jgi:class 3 adenylate cyclase
MAKRRSFDRIAANETRHAQLTENSSQALAHASDEQSIDPGDVSGILRDILDIANDIGERLHGPRPEPAGDCARGGSATAGSILTAYREIVSSISTKFKIDCVVFATWDKKRNKWSNSFLGTDRPDAFSPALVMDALHKEVWKNVAERNDVVHYAPPDRSALRNLGVRRVYAHPVSIRMDSGLPAFRNIGLLACLFSSEEHVNELIAAAAMKHVARILGRASYSFLRPYLGNRRIVEGNYELGQFFKEQDRDATFLFADLRNFTAVTELFRAIHGDKRLQSQLDPDGRNRLSIHRILKEFQGLMSHILRDNVRIHEMAGDGIYAVFCNLLAESDSEDARRLDCLKALCSAIQMQIAFRALRQHWEKNWLHLYRKLYNEDAALDLGIGINAGDAVFSDFGVGGDVRFTAIGDHVNFAQRLCDQAARSDDKGNQTPHILLSQTAYSLIESYVESSRFQRVLLNLKGKSGRYPVYGLTGSESGELARAIRTGACQNLFLKDPHKHYFCAHRDRESEGLFICQGEWEFHGDAFDFTKLTADGKPILRDICTAG